MNKVITEDLDRFVVLTKGWTQKFVLDVYAPLKFSFIIYPNFLKDLFICRSTTFTYYRWLWLGLDTYRKEMPGTHNPFSIRYDFLND